MTLMLDTKFFRMSVKRNVFEAVWKWSLTRKSELSDQSCNEAKVAMRPKMYHEITLHGLCKLDRSLGLLYRNSLRQRHFVIIFDLVLIYKFSTEKILYTIPYCSWTGHHSVVSAYQMIEKTSLSNEIIKKKKINLQYLDIPTRSSTGWILLRKFHPGLQSEN